MKHFIWLLLFFTVAAQSQFRISGIVKDAASGKALPFANITVKNGPETITDIDGKFSVPADDLVTFRISYIGYESREIRISPNKNYFTVLLSPQAEKLSEITVGAKENPANAIIRNTIKAKTRNNPQKMLQSFRFKSYNKLVITANPDSIDGSIDSVFIKKSRKIKIDSSDYKFKKLLRKQHLFQTEKVSEYEFDGSKLKETIIGTKMAGFKQPVYEIIAFNLQSFSIYDSSYELFETKYNSPIARDAFSDYTFRLLDTVTVSGRKTYMVYFQPKKKSKTAGLQGALYIDAESYAVAKAIMRIKGILDISATHDFEYIPDQDIWFPANKEFKIVKGKNDEDIRVLGETLTFDAETNDNSKREKQASDFTYLFSKSWNFDIEYNVPVTIKRAAVSIQVTDDAIKKDDAFWESYRKDSLDLRGRQTYVALDSIAQKEGVEKKIRIGRKVLNGYIPVGPIDFDLRYLLSFNNYEGFRFGLGGITNEKFSRKYRMEGYSAYGTKDGGFKYNLGGAARIGKFSGTWIGGSYTDDVKEIASTTFAIDKRVFKLYDPRPINVSTFYSYVSWRGYLETRIIPKTESIWQLTQSRIEPKFNYVFNDNGNLYNVFHMTTAMVSLQWNPFSDYMQTPTGRLEIEKRFPKFTFQFTQSVPKLLENDFNFSKIDFRAEYEKKYLNGQKTNVLLEAGYASGDVPLTHLYSTSPNSLTKEKLIERITIAGKNSFETMYFNEFFSSQYVMLQFKHGSKRVTLFRNVRPSLVLVTRMAWGTMQKPEQHIGIDYKTLDKGYFESGIELNQIYKVFGLTGFYRYGANQLPRFEDNISIKLSAILNLGF